MDGAGSCDLLANSLDALIACMRCDEKRRGMPEEVGYALVATDT
jgi:hypothetical protein